MTTYMTQRKINQLKNDLTTLRAEVERLRGENERLIDACQMAYDDLEQYEYTDLPGGYAVMATVQKLRAALEGGE